MECLECVLRAFWPDMISRSEFVLIRQSYMATYDVAPPFDFVALTRQCLELDASRLVGISLDMWLVVVLLVLLSGLIGWLGALMVGMAGVMILAVNVRLCYVIRYRCRGGRANVMQVDRRVRAAGTC